MGIVTDSTGLAEALIGASRCIDHMEPIKVLSRHLTIHNNVASEISFFIGNCWVQQALIVAGEAQIIGVGLGYVLVVGSHWELSRQKSVEIRSMRSVATRTTHIDGGVLRGRIHLGVDIRNYSSRGACSNWDFFIVTI